MGDINGDGLVNRYDLDSDLNRISFFSFAHFLAILSQISLILLSISVAPVCAAICSIVSLKPHFL